MVQNTSPINMPLSPFDLMQAAVDIVGTSTHPTSKVAATIAGDGFSYAHINDWPPAIRKTIGTETRIGNSSGTVHAETMCLWHAPKTQGAAMFITDPPCPNCVKYMAEAGIKALYIDHKGFDKDFARRRGDDFENMSLRICQRAGIDVFEIWRKEEKIMPIFTTPDGYEPPEENPVMVEPTTTEENWVETQALAMTEMLGETVFAFAQARDKSGTPVLIAAQTHPIIGYTSATMENKEDKYSFLVQPVTRVMMAAKRHGLTLEPETLYSSIVPTARQLVNMVGAGLTSLHIGDPERSRDEFGPIALEQLVQAGILRVLTTDEHR